MTAFAHAGVFDPGRVEALLRNTPAFDRGRFTEVLAKAGRLEGLSLEEIAFLSGVEAPEDRQALADAAIRVKEAIYGPRLVLFAPLYTSSHCINECLYCGFRSRSGTPRRRLSGDEVKRETEALIAMGHKRVLMVAGEDPRLTARDLADQMAAIYSVQTPKGNIRRVNVNCAPLDEDGFKQLKAVGIGTSQCFQETYHPETYRKMHPRGPKSDMGNRLHVFDRCIRAGIDDFGMGVLFGLYDYRYEVLALMEHIAWLEREFGIGPHTISIPRLEPAEGTDVFETTPWKVSDADLIKVTAILRLAVPYTGIILSTREGAALRRELLRVGVSQMSAASITNPGGYAEGEETVPQFAVQDHRSLDEVIREVCQDSYIPSFCTGCYRKGRTGEKFQEMAKHQYIGTFCSLNAVATLQEFLEDYASEETRVVAERRLGEFIERQPDPEMRRRMQEWRARIKNGERDIPY